MKILVIGGGPGGYVAAIRGAQLGADVTIVEKNRLGGTCLNVGCIPTKALLDSAHVFHQTKSSLDIGIEANPILHWDKVQARRKSIIDTLVGGVEGLMKVNKIKVEIGEARFKDKTTVEVIGSGKTNTIKFDKCIIATGSQSIKLPIEGIDLQFCIDSTDALAFDKVPKSMVVVGGGVIGVELACAYNAFGTKITIVEMQKNILPLMDKEFSDKLRKILESQGIKILTNAKVSKFEKSSIGGKCKVNHDGVEQVLEAEKVLLSLGRKAYLDNLNAEGIGIKVEKNAIKVDEYMLTSVASIYAIGDCNAKLMLAHAASEQGVIAAENAMGSKHTYDDKVCPSGVYSFPEFASVGLTEEQVKEKGIDYTVGVFPTMANGRSLILKENSGAVKIIADKKYKEILGVHILGAQATDLIAEAALAIKLECSVDEIINTIHAHPTLSECIHEAALSVEKRMLHMPNKK